MSQSLERSPFTHVHKDPRGEVTKEIGLGCVPNSLQIQSTTEDIGKLNRGPLGDRSLLLEYMPISERHAWILGVGCSMLQMFYLRLPIQGSEELTE